MTMSDLRILEHTQWVVRTAVACTATTAALLLGAPAAHASDGWSAIAYSDDNGAYGLARNFADKKEAEAAAMATCVQRGGGNCRIAVRSQGGCVALAYGAGWQGGQGPTVAAAEADALDRNGGGAILTSGC
jgi:Domain of unknown function (DUF4189)